MSNYLLLLDVIIMYYHYMYYHCTDTQDLVVKAQILAGGRGLGVFENGLKGGVQLCHRL